jgi:hypothetical protein
MDDSDATVLSLLENQAALQRDLVQAKDPSKFKLGYCGHMYLGHFNPSVQRLAETTEQLWETAQRRDSLLGKIMEGAPAGGVKSGKTRAATADKEWRNEATTAANKILIDNPAIKIGALATDVIFKIDYKGDHSTVAKYLRTLFENNTLKRPPL